MEILCIQHVRVPISYSARVSENVFTLYSCTILSILVIKSIHYTKSIHASVLSAFLPHKLKSLSLIVSYPFVGSKGPKQSHKTKKTMKQPITECTMVMNKITAN